ncbi:MAG: elongation factor P maturation arginine rhamnosyltransferase EarP [Pseudomonadota bacterium]|nr:elongation factor P maturation arginine rhamnosyltransferase EarP [Pseudomonadota bacterium]
MKHSLQWDIFCKVIDNFGDIGVCWRLAADLARRGHRVRLWVDDASALAWMAPGGCAGVRVLPWTEPPELPAAGLDLRATGLDLPAIGLDLSAAGLEQQPPDVLIEAFGCDIPFQFLAACADQSRANGIKPVWINLEYLSAEPYVERCHALPSLVQRGPAAGWTKWFFYPGFTEATGGLLREPDLLERQAGFDRSAWLAAQGIDWQGEHSGEKLVSLFCYEPLALDAFLAQLAEQGLAGQPVCLLVAAGRAEQAVKVILNDQGSLTAKASARANTNANANANADVAGRHKPLSISYLKLLTQADFDHLLWACELNFVRGEDSVIRAVWAGKPFVWQIYPQEDQAHLAKLSAFLDTLVAPAAARDLHAAWNQGRTGPAQASLILPELAAWEGWTRATRARLMAQDDLSSRLLGFVAKKR